MNEIIKRTQDELLAELKARFGDDPMNWAFVCPSCKDVATGQDFRTALDQAGDVLVKASDRLGQECIGRTLGALDAKKQEDWKGRGCDWVAYGLFHGPEFAVTPEGKEIAHFSLAEARA